MAPHSATRAVRRTRELGGTSSPAPRTAAPPAPCHAPPSMPPRMQPASDALLSHKPRHPHLVTHSDRTRSQRHDPCRTTLAPRTPPHRSALTLAAATPNHLCHRAGSTSFRNVHPGRHPQVDPLTSTCGLSKLSRPCWPGWHRRPPEASGCCCRAQTSRCASTCVCSLAIPRPMWADCAHFLAAEQAASTRKHRHARAHAPWPLVDVS